jgi:hypothetical protein
MINWIDSHAQNYYDLAYISRWGYKPTTFFIIPPILIFLGLLLIYRNKRRDPVIAGILASALIFSSQLVGWLGFSLRVEGPPLVVSILHLFLAAIVGLTVSEHFYGFLIPHFEKLNLKSEFKERLRVWGYLINIVTMITISGGLVCTIIMVSQAMSLPLTEETKIIWAKYTPLLYIYLSYGIFGVFLLRYSLNMVNLKKRMKNLASEIHRKSSSEKGH